MAPEKIAELRRLLVDATREHEADPLSYETLLADVALRAAATSALPELLDAAERDSRTTRYCDECGKPEHEHEQYMGEPCWVVHTSEGPSPERCGYWASSVELIRQREEWASQVDRLTRERDAAIEELADARIVVADGKAEVQA